MRASTPVVPKPILLVLLCAALLAAPVLGQRARGAPPALPAWSLEAPGPAPWRLHPLEGALLVEDAAGTVTAVDLQQGLPLWRVDLGAPLVAAPREHAGILTLTAGLRAVTVVLASGVLLDDRRLPSAASASAVVHDELLFVPTLTGNLHAFALGGDRIWTHRELAGPPRQLALVPDGARPLLVLHDGARALHALPAHGELADRPVWRHALGAAPVGALQVDAGGAVYVAVADGRLVSLEGRSGRVRWQAPLPGAPGAGLLRAGEVLVVGGSWGLRAHAAADGALLWSRPGAALPLSAGRASVLVRTGPTEELWLGAADGRELAPPGHAPRQLVGGLLLGWDGSRLRAWHAGQVRAARADAGPAGALN